MLASIILFGAALPSIPEYNTMQMCAGDALASGDAPTSGDAFASGDPVTFPQIPAANCQTWQAPLVSGLLVQNSRRVSEQREVEEEI